MRTFLAVTDAMNVDIWYILKNRSDGIDELIAVVSELKLKLTSGQYNCLLKAKIITPTMFIGDDVSNNLYDGYEGCQNSIFLFQLENFLLFCFTSIGKSV